MANLGVANIDPEGILFAFLNIAAQHRPHGVVGQERPGNVIERRERAFGGIAAGCFPAIVDGLRTAFRVFEDRVEEADFRLDPESGERGIVT